MPPDANQRPLIFGPPLSASEEAVLRTALDHHAQGRIAHAGQAYFSLLTNHPDHPGLQFQMGQLAFMANRFDQAEFHFRKAAKAAPGWVAPLVSLGVVLDLLGREEEALRAFGLALSMAPRDPGLITKSSTTLHHLGRIRESLASVERALEIDENHLEALLLRAELLRDCGRAEESDRAYRLALEHHPQSARARYYWGCVQLSRGFWEEGWTDYDARRQGPQNPAFPMRDHAPDWDGRIVPGLRLLVRLEQGLGDTLQFIRYVWRLLEEGVTVVVQRPHGAQDPLLSLLAAQGRPVTILGPMEEGPPVDAQAMLLSLPLCTGWRPGELPLAPYLAAPVEAQQRWRDRILALPGPRVGVAWQGNRLHWDNHRRSPGLAAILEAGAGIALQWVSLQKDPEFSSGPPEGLTDWMPEVRDFADTAAIVDGLDAVVAIDSSVAHLAGALGKPVFLLLPEPAEWRWLRHGDRSPWYARHLLLRQQVPGDWQHPLQRLRTELLALVGSPSDAGTVEN